MKNFRFSYLLIVYLLSRCTDPATGVASGATIGAFIQMNLNKVQDVIREAESAGKGVTIEAAIQAQNTIKVLQYNYQSSMDKTIESLNDSEKKAFIDADNLISQLNSNIGESSNEILDRAQTIVNTFPFAKEFPLITNYSPKYLIPNQSKYRFIIKGNFPFAFSNDNRPTLKINKKKYYGSYFTKEIAFEIPKEDLPKLDSNFITYLHTELDIYWKKNVFLIFKKNEMTRYEMDIPVLPYKVGEFSLTSYKDTVQYEEKYIASGDFYFDSSSDDHEENRTLMMSDQDIQEGWHIKPGSWRFELRQHIEGTQNHDWYDKGYQSSSDYQVVWRARTEHKSWGSSGKIVWRIGSLIYRFKKYKIKSIDPITVLWGESKVFTFPPGDWILEYKKFDGTIQQFNSTDLKNDFIKIYANNNSLRIATYTN